MTDSAFIKYPGSDTGTAYVGVYKTPLTENKTGYGFKGVILQDEDREFVQCYICGAWRKVIGNFHLKMHRVTQKEYREMFGLLKHSPLCSDAASEERARCRRMAKRPHQVDPAERFKRPDSDEIEAKRVEAIKISKNSEEFRNMKGTCEEQIKKRLIAFIWEKQRLPHSRNGGTGLVNLLRNRYGSYCEGLRHYGLPYPKQRGRVTEYHFPDGFVYNYHTYTSGNWENLFTLMIHKCSILFT